MAEVDPFWKLQGAAVISSQCEFYQHLSKSDHLMRVIYQPDELKRASPDRVQRIEGKKFEWVSFSKTSINGIVFRDCVFKNCQFIAAAIEGCEFHKCRFISTNMHKISIHKTYIDPNSFDKCLDRKKHQNIGVHLYQSLMNNLRDAEQIEFERDAQFLFFRWKRYQAEYELRNKWSKATSASEHVSVALDATAVLRRLAWEKLFGCGIRLRFFLRTVTVTVVLATLINFFFIEQFGLSLGGAPISTLSEASYFTVVSLTTLGYGDITPTTSLGRLAASIQSVIGFSLFALLASMLFRRVTP